MRRGARIGIDYGEARIGVAVCDSDARVVLPRTVVRRDRFGTDIDDILDIVEDIEAIEIVVGLPRHLSGREGEVARAAESFARKLDRACRDAGHRVRVCLVDERLTSSSAHAQLESMGIGNRQRRGRVDQLAAAMILEQALEIERHSATPPGRTVNGSESRRAHGDDRCHNVRKKRNDHG